MARLPTQKPAAALLPIRTPPYPTALTGKHGWEGKPYHHFPTPPLKEAFPTHSRQCHGVPGVRRASSHGLCPASACPVPAAALAAWTAQEPFQARRASSRSSSGRPCPGARLGGRSPRPAPAPAPRGRSLLPRWPPSPERVQGAPCHDVTQGRLKTKIDWKNFGGVSVYYLPAVQCCQAKRLLSSASAQTQTRYNRARNLCAKMPDFYTQLNFQQTESYC